MNTRTLILLSVFFLLPSVAWAQGAAPPAASALDDDGPVTVIAQQPQSEVTPPPGKPMVKIRTRGPVVAGLTGGPVIGGAVRGFKYEPLEGGEFGPAGTWWKNSEIVSKLNLSDEQVRKISQTFLDHKLKLIDLQADLDKQELRLQPLLDIDQPDESKVSAQIDLITASRGRLEKENAMMMLDIRRWLSVEQWKKLESLEAVEPGPKNVFYIQRDRLPSGPVLQGPPPPVPDDMPVLPREKH